MLANRRLARSIADVGFYEFRRQLTYKSAWYQNDLYIANRWYPSSKTCSHCGAVAADLSLSDRLFACASCEMQADRDYNAAVNLVNLLNTESSSGIHALGQDGDALIFINQSNQQFAI